MFLPRQAGFPSPASRVTFVSDAELEAGHSIRVPVARVAALEIVLLGQLLTVVNRSRRSRVWVQTVDRVLWAYTSRRGAGGPIRIGVRRRHRLLEHHRDAALRTVLRDREARRLTWILAKPIDPTEGRGGQSAAEAVRPRQPLWRAMTARHLRYSQPGISVGRGCIAKSGRYFSPYPNARSNPMCAPQMRARVGAAPTPSSAPPRTSGPT